ncbi:MAG TPA: preprotein translocase subunit SecG [Patescibacteria group bacterium]|nr:preprotein translocase subunit SecG [Patescibacteria group bacterium]
MQDALRIMQVITGAAMITLILLQAKGSGISAVFGGDGGMYRSRRGVEKLMHRSTILLAIVFMGLALANFLITK